MKGEKKLTNVFLISRDLPIVGTDLDTRDLLCLNFVWTIFEGARWESELGGTGGKEELTGV